MILAWAAAIRPIVNRAFWLRTNCYSSGRRPHRLPKAEGYTCARASKASSNVVGPPQLEAGEADAYSRHKPAFRLMPTITKAYNRHDSGC